MGPKETITITSNELLCVLLTVMVLRWTEYINTVRIGPDAVQHMHSEAAKLENGPPTSRGPLSWHAHTHHSCSLS
jgi:hypothetical protein